MNKLISQILDNELFVKKPIVLAHIGSAGSNFENWKKIASKSILVCIDPSIDKSNHKSFIKVHYLDELVDNKSGYKNFYITKDPHCSSLLEPNKKIFNQWYGAHRFKLAKKKKFKVTTLNQCLEKYNIKNIDWLIIDAQGIDLKIFKSIKKQIQSNISIVDLEPGFFEFYKNCDKISDIFKYMNKNFEFEDMNFGVNFKVNSKNLSFFEKKILFKFNNPSKIYSNVTFLNKNKKNIRSDLLKIIYLIMNKKFFDARELALNYKHLPFYKELIKIINFKLFQYKVVYIVMFPVYILKKIFNIIIKLN